MATYTLTAAIPGIRLVPGMIVKLEAIDPTTGLAVSGVTASAWAIFGQDLTPAAGEDAPTPSGPFMLVPGPDAS